MKNSAHKMDLDYRVLNLYRSRRFDKCILLCGSAPGQKSRIQHYVEMRSITIQAKVTGSYYDETDYFAVDDNMLGYPSLAKTPRPGTTFLRDATVATQSGSDTSVRAGTAMRARTGTARATRTARTSRTALATAARAARAATALQSAGADAATPIALTVLTSQLLHSAISKTLFEYVFFSEGNVRKAMEIVTQGQKGSEGIDWWWNFSASQCYMALGLKRNVEECLRLALKQNQHISIYLRLISMYTSLNQPLSALKMCENGLTLFPNDTTLHLEQARIYEAMGNQSLSIKEYRNVAIHDPDNMEAVANIALYNFYNDQPEIALRYYRRLVATTPPNAELMNNLGLCCLSCNQLDLVMPCFRHALLLATSSEAKAELWFNLAHVSLIAGDLSLAQRCLQASLAMLSNFPPALIAYSRLKNFLKNRVIPSTE